MAVVVSGLDEKYLPALRKNLENAGIDLVKENDPAGIIEDLTVNTADTIILGDHVDNPILYAQKIHEIDKFVSVLIVREPVDYNRFNNALKFSPYLGYNVKCVNISSNSRIAPVVVDMVNRTKQRRSFQQVASSMQSSGAVRGAAVNNYLDRFLDLAPVGAILLSTDLRVLAMNREARRMLQRTEASLIGYTIATPFEEQEGARLLEFLKSERTDKGSEIFFRRNNDQGSQYIEISLSEIPADHGQSLKLIVLQEVTEKIRSQQELTRTVEELQKTNRELLQIAWVMSHDLSSPIRAVSSIADFLLLDYSKALGQEGTDLVRQLKARAMNMRELLQGILEYTRIGRHQVRKTKIVPEQVITEILKALTPEENVTITISSAIPAIHFNERHFQQIIYHLLTNAIRYNDRENKKVEISAADEGEMVRFFVKDNGRGIEPEHQKKIFEIFQTLNRTKSLDHTGLGLALVKKLIETSGGSILLESEPGEGSTFMFTIPKYSEEPDGDGTV